MQRRLSDDAVDDLARAHLALSPTDALAATLGVHRTTIIDHLDRRGVERRKVVRKMTDQSVREAAKRATRANRSRWWRPGSVLVKELVDHRASRATSSPRMVT